MDQHNDYDFLTTLSPNFPPRSDSLFTGYLGAATVRNPVDDLSMYERCEQTRQTSK